MLRGKGTGFGCTGEPEFEAVNTVSQGQLSGKIRSVKPQVFAPCPLKSVQNAHVPIR